MDDQISGRRPCGSLVAALGILSGLKREKQRTSPLIPIEGPPNDRDDNAMA
jgi:hypothetical protein